MAIFTFGSFTAVSAVEGAVGGGEGDTPSRVLHGSFTATMTTVAHLVDQVRPAPAPTTQKVESP